jgi:hypothetical protein
MTRLQCACCDHFTLAGTGWEICPVCFWEDDGTTLAAPDRVSWPNHLTLREARANFAEFGAKVVGVKGRRRYEVVPRAVP